MACFNTLKCVYLFLFYLKRVLLLSMSSYCVVMYRSRGVIYGKNNILRGRKTEGRVGREKEGQSLNGYIFQLDRMVFAQIKMGLLCVFPCIYLFLNSILNHSLFS